MKQRGAESPRGAGSRIEDDQKSFDARSEGSCRSARSARSTEPVHDRLHKLHKEKLDKQKMLEQQRPVRKAPVFLNRAKSARNLDGS